MTLMKTARFTVAALAAAAVLVACYSQYDGVDCSPGYAYACTGAGGCSGQQVCDSTGTGYGACQCGAGAGPDAGGVDGAADGSTTDSSAGEASVDAASEAAADATSTADGAPPADATPE